MPIPLPQPFTLSPFNAHSLEPYTTIDQRITSFAYFLPSTCMCIIAPPHLPLNLYGDKSASGSPHRDLLVENAITLEPPEDRKNIGLTIDLLRLDELHPPPLGMENLSDRGKNPPLLLKNGDFIPLLYGNENNLALDKDPNGDGRLLQKLPPSLLYLHGDTVAGSVTSIRSDTAKLRSNPKE